jgi:2'-5' RNA ligase
MEDSPALRWVGDDQLHLTLRFIGEVETPLANDIAAALARVRSPKFNLRVNGIGTFARRNGGALWAAVEPKEPIARLAAKVERSLQQTGLKPEPRAFKPHITLARWNRGSADAVDGFVRKNRDLATSLFPVDSFILFESRLSRHGPHYEPVAACPLE